MCCWLSLLGFYRYGVASEVSKRVVMRNYYYKLLHIVAIGTAMELPGW